MSTRNGEKKRAIEEAIRRIKTEYEEKYVRELHSLISPAVRYIALKYLHNVHDAEDLVQDFWMEIKKIADSYHFNKNAFGYLCKTAQNMALNRLRKIENCKKHEFEFVNFSELYGRENEIRKQKIQTTVEQAMERLNDLQKIIIQTTYFERKTIREIAKDLDLSKSTVHREKQIALKLLKDELSKYYD